MAGKKSRKVGLFLWPIADSWLLAPSRARHLDESVTRLSIVAHDYHHAGHDFLADNANLDFAHAPGGFRDACSEFVDVKQMT